MLLPADGAVAGLDLLVEAAGPATIEVELWDTGRPENYVPHTLRARASAAVREAGRQWVTVPLAWTPAKPQNAFIVVKANDSVSLLPSEQPMTGVLSFLKGEKPRVSSNLEDHQPEQPVVQWSMRALVRKPFCFRLHGETNAYRAERALDGYLRPFGGPHMWISETLAKDAQPTLELAWDSPVSISEVQITFNDDVNEDLINLHHHRTPFAVFPELVRDYRIEAFQAGEWRTVHEELGNRKRTRRHAFGAPISAEKLRLVVEATNGSAYAEVIEIRAYP